MLNLLYDFFPVLLFFIAFKFYGIYVATVVGIVVTAFQVVTTTIWRKKIDKQQLVTLIVFTIFGGLTLYFHNPIFVKWKPSIIFWIFGCVILFSQFIGSKPLIQRMLAHLLEEGATLPIGVWRKLNLVWAIFFLILGSINIFVAYHFSTNAWVNFKLYGVLGLLILFSIGQAVYLTKYFAQEKNVS
jgi:intracellular septation protein